ncbi:MAG TPA: metallophosphoesterase family protein [Solirubrobacteraceae bacterium]|nr:metallophosphoesterase family protein [Solirubrobacteraceae bacterium]
MRVAVLADIHGNLPALRAALAELDAGGGADAIVVAGDVVGGAMVREVLELLEARPERRLWIRGNSEREAVAAWDGAAVDDDAPGRAAAWSARALDRRWRDRLASWPIADDLDGVCFCHGSPRRDDETLTRETPDAVLREALAGVSQAMVVGGHTHQQVIRTAPDAPAYVNAGSVGMPYEGRPGAFWLLLQDGVPSLRETAYDIGAAVGELRASGFPDVDDQVTESLITPADPGWVAAFFEHAAGRAPDPGPMPPR